MEVNIKRLIIALLIIASTTHANELNLTCSEFSVGENTEEHMTIESAVKKLNTKGSKVLVKIFQPEKENECFKYITERDQFQDENLKLDIEKTNNYCVYDNRGISPATYGFVCKK